MQQAMSATPHHWNKRRQAIHTCSTECFGIQSTNVNNKSVHECQRTCHVRRLYITEILRYTMPRNARAQPSPTNINQNQRLQARWPSNQSSNRPPRCQHESRPTRKTTNGRIHGALGARDRETKTTERRTIKARNAETATDLPHPHKPLTQGIQRQITTNQPKIPGNHIPTTPETRESTQTEKNKMVYGRLLCRKMTRCGQYNDYQPALLKLLA